MSSPHAERSSTEGLAALCARPATQDDRRAAALHLLDWLGCAIAGAATPAGRKLASTGGAAHPMTHAGAGSPEAAFLLGGLGSLLEMDDVHRGAILHPGPVVCAAALALAPADASSGAGSALLDAILAGYEAMIRLGAAVGPGHYAFFHNTGTCGGLGSALAASRLLGLSREETVFAMGHAASLSAGLWQCRNEPGETKHVHVAEAARRGAHAAVLARAGLGAPRFVLEGPLGFFPALAPGGDPAAILRDPDAPFALHATSFKPWPACRHAHPAIDAALALRADLAGEPQSIRVETYRDSILFCDRPNPASPHDARFSLQHAVAVALRDGPPGLAAFEKSGLDDPAYAALRARVAVAEDAAFTARYPARFGARVTIVDASGATRVFEAPDAWGDAENPMAAGDVVAKFRALARAGGASDDAARAIEAAALGLPEGEPPATLIGALRALSY